MRRSSSARAAVLATLCLISLAACTTAGSSFPASPTPPAADITLAPPVETPTPEPTEEPTETPTPEPTPTPVPPIDYGAVCLGHGDPTGPAYHGSPHPVQIMDMSNPDYPQQMSVVGPDGDIQLVVCVGPSASIKVRDCGTYQLVGGRTKGHIYAYKQARKVTVRAVLDGKALTSSTLYGNAASCNQRFSVNVNDGPPWRVVGGDVSDAQITAYAVSASKMKA